MVGLPVVGRPPLGPGVVLELADGLELVDALGLVLTVVLAEGVGLVVELADGLGVALVVELTEGLGVGVFVFPYP
jgi:hypothetical protein